MAEHRPAVTIDHVALAAGVSRSTASRVLSGGGPASGPAGRRVRAAAERLGYVPNPMARALARGVAGTRIVIVACSPGGTLAVDAYLARVLAGAASAGDAEGLGVSAQGLSLAAPEAGLARLAADPSVRGVVLVNTTHEVLAALPARLRGRVASIGIGSDDVPAFDIDNGASATALVRHLLATGRRRIAMVSGPDWLPCARRPVDSYLSLMVDAGLPALVLPGDFSVASGRAGARAALRLRPDTDAIFGICDDTALGAMAELRDLGVDVPGDVAVAGSDDVPLAALAAPALTTATNPVERIAARAAAAVLDSTRGRAHWSCPSDLVLRKSA